VWLLCHYLMIRFSGIDHIFGLFLARCSPIRILVLSLSPFLVSFIAFWSFRRSHSHSHSTQYEIFPRVYLHWEPCHPGTFLWLSLSLPSRPVIFFFFALNLFFSLVLDKEKQFLNSPYRHRNFTRMRRDDLPYSLLSLSSSFFSPVIKLFFRLISNWNGF